MLANGHVFATERGLDRDRSIVLRIPRELMAALPKREECDDVAVGAALDFLLEEWLYDVAWWAVGRQPARAGPPRARGYGWVVASVHASLISRVAAGFDGRASAEFTFYRRLDAILAAQAPSAACVCR